MGRRRSEISQKSFDSLYFISHDEGIIEELKELFMQSLNERELKLIFG